MVGVSGIPGILKTAPLNGGSLVLMDLRFKRCARITRAGAGETFGYLTVWMTSKPSNSGRPA